MKKKILTAFFGSTFEIFVIAIIVISSTYWWYLSSTTSKLVQTAATDQITLIDRIMADNRINLSTSREVLIKIKNENTKLLIDEQSITKTLAWPFVIGAILVISSLLAVRFTLNSIVIKSSDPETKMTVEKGTANDVYEDQDMLTWICENAIQKNSGSLDLEKAQLWRQITVYAQDLGLNKPLLIDSINELLASTLNDENSQESKQADLFNVFEEIKDRLTREVTRLNNQSVSNMLSGFTLAFGLVFYNGYSALNNPMFNFELSALSNFFLPKLVIVISLLTMFVYFMRLYKSNIADVKYYQNELTNIEIKLTSVRLALLSSDKEVLDILVKDLSSVERNSVFGKEQTSLELERLKTENDLHKDFLSKALEIFSTSKKV